MKRASDNIKPLELKVFHCQKAQKMKTLSCSPVLGLISWIHTHPFLHSFYSEAVLWCIFGSNLYIYTQAYMKSCQDLQLHVDVLNDKQVVFLALTNTLSLKEKKSMTSFHDFYYRQCFSCF